MKFFLKLDPERLKSITNRRILFFFLFVATFLITEAGRKIYRPYIYANDIFDFWIADTIGNFTGTMAIIFFEIALINPDYRAGRLVTVFITIGLIGYELVQGILPGTNTLDWRDIVATVVAGLIALGVYQLVNLKIKEKTVMSV